MKKFFPAFMAFLLVFSTVGPLPGFAVDSTIFKITTQKNDGDDHSDVVVKIVDESKWENLTLFKEYVSDTGILFETITLSESSQEGTFKNVPAGEYKVTAKKATLEGEAPIYKEERFTIRPDKFLEEDFDSSIPRTITINNIGNADEIRLYSEPGGKFTKIDTNITTINVKNAGLYSLTRVRNGAESKKTLAFNIKPNNLNITTIGHYRGLDSKGNARVTGVKEGNKINVSKVGDLTYSPEIKVIGSTVDIINLSYGEYKVSQEENGIDSDATTFIIENRQTPNITLKGEVNMEMIHSTSNPLKNKYNEPGYVIKNKNDVESPATHKENLTCEDSGINVKVNLDFTSSKKTKLDGDGSELTPGIYQVKYTGTDCENTNLSDSKERLITVLPEELASVKVRDTKEVHGDSPIEKHIDGNLVVTTNYQKAKLLLYHVKNQDVSLDTLQPIDIIDVDNDPTSIGKEFIFKNVKVNELYYVVQEVNNIKSKKGSPYVVKDTTSPEIKFTGEKDNKVEIELEVGTNYTEPEYNFEDNVDHSSTLKSLLVKSGQKVDITFPGNYTVNYNLKDIAGNEAIEKKVIITVKPRPVTIYRSKAIIGEISVEGIFPGTDAFQNNLKLYKINEINDTQTTLVKQLFLKSKQTTEVFTDVSPGFYYVTQTINGQVSSQSNVVEIVDIDKPHITLIGPEKLSYVINEEMKPYYTNETSIKFDDPGIVADDYLVSKEKQLYLTATLLNSSGNIVQTNGELTHPESNIVANGEITTPNQNVILQDGTIRRKKGNIIETDGRVKTPEGSYITQDEDVQIDPYIYNIERRGKKIKFSAVKFPAPDTYKIKYTAKALRGAEATTKYRTIIVAPPKTSQPTYEKLGSKLTVNLKKYHDSLHNTYLITTAKLYNSYGQLMDTIIADKSNTDTEIVTFKDVLAGTGYYVTQTVNGIESQPSLPVNVSIFEDAKPTALITSFSFKEVDAISVIDHKAGEIHVTVPKTINLNSLTPVITSIGTVTPNPQVKTDFSNGKRKSYRVENSAEDNTTVKTYTVTVKHAVSSSIGSLPLKKYAELTSLSPSVSLSPTEVETAKDHGVTFITRDKKVEAHVPASNVMESRHFTFTLKQPLANGPYEISFGNLSRFMQPIELKLPKSGTKTLSKLVDGYTVAVPSETTSTSTTSLVNEPGTYALVDNVSAPLINLPATGSAAYTLQLALLETPGTIYYTTSSKDISFISSALSSDKQLKDRYIATASPADILNWTKYTPNDKISTPTGELYAVVIKGNQISQITALEAAPAIDWSKNIPSYDTHKVLNINFNARVDRDALYSGLIYVTDDATNQNVATTLQLSSDEKTIYVIPQQAYIRGKQYTLHIDRRFKGNTKNKEFLKQSLLQTFTIK
ncbi:immunoglobulin-like domain-containing protein [Sporosarcina ureae]|uniref:immunoglobulin-like domain-containing protein n=1 Tax=Sporosarcina ureae TaxID=1571 RepID=UPI0009DC5C33|nr:immunoglobulin-like domain-containing protein [Sporosarcina ureae]ARF18103.1 hypothetical protein SporoP17a_12950 [Sporosarcina ureae]